MKNKSINRCRYLEFDSALDIGYGGGWASEALRDLCGRVTAIDARRDAKEIDGVNCIRGHNYIDYQFCHKFDLIFASHVLEHQLEPNTFLNKIRKDLSDDGHALITVPPHKEELAGGHVTTWNAGMLVYHLVLAGFDCRQCEILSEGYNVSVLVKNSHNGIDINKLTFSSRDIGAVQKFFPGSIRFGRTGIVNRFRWNVNKKS